MPFVEFRPATPAGTDFQRSQESTSMMLRARQSRMEQERLDISKQQEARRQWEFDQSKPLYEAQVANGLTQAQNEREAGLQMSGFYQQANQEMPFIRNEWLSASMINDPAERLNKMGQVLAKASKYSSLSGVGNEVKAWQNIYGIQATEQRALYNISASNYRADERNRTQLELQGQRDVAASQRLATIEAGRTERAKMAKSLTDPRALEEMAVAADNLAIEFEEEGDAEQAAKERTIAQGYRNRSKRLNAPPTQKKTAQEKAEEALAAMFPNEAAPEEDQQTKEQPAAAPVQDIGSLLNGLTF